MKKGKLSMNDELLKYSFKVTPVFDYIQEQAEQAGLFIIHNHDAKRSLQLFMNKKSFENRDYYIGAIQYEGSKDYEKKEPNLVSWRFKRSNIPNELRQKLELITSFRRDKNDGPAVNPESESIAFKFSGLNEEAKKTMSEIVNTLKQFS